MRKWLAALTVLVVLLAVGVVALKDRRDHQEHLDLERSEAVATRFLELWQSRSYAQMGALTVSDPDAGDSFQLLAQRLRASTVTVRPGTFSDKGTHLTFHVAAQLQGLGPLAWDDTLTTAKTAGGWRIDFLSSTVYPGLENGEVLTRSTPTTSRGQIVDRHGTPIRPASDDLAANVLGSMTGTKTGLERVYDDQLTGTSGGRVEVLQRSSGMVVRVVKTFPPTPTHAVTTTLDLPLQRAAEGALKGVTGQAAIVVLDTATSEIRAVADSPVAGLPAAFYSEAPGSTFKIVVATDALQHGVKPSTVVACPAQAVFGGKSFHNDEPLPARMTFATAFARSCNTAFLTIAKTYLPKGSLRALAPTFGFNTGPLLTTGAQGGTIPAPGSTSEAYADVIGQGKVEASPLLMASVSAAVASGSWRRPHLISGDVPAVPLPAEVLPQLRQLMAGVVTSGTAASAGLPTGTRGKTGTAEYGTTVPLPTHAWFTGYLGNLAFCVYVKDGRTGGSVAAPVAARFLRLAR